MSIEDTVFHIACLIDTLAQEYEEVELELQEIRLLHSMQRRSISVTARARVIIFISILWM